MCRQLVRAVEQARDQAHIAAVGARCKGARYITTTRVDTHAGRIRFRCEHDLDQCIATTDQVRAIGEDSNLARRTG